MNRSIPGKCRWPTRLLLLVIAAVRRLRPYHEDYRKSDVPGSARPFRLGHFSHRRQDGGSSAIEPDGSYAIEGVPAGEVKIGIISRDPSRGRSTARRRKTVHQGEKGADKGEIATQGWFPLPAPLEDPETSGQSCTVGSGDVSHDIDLQ